MHKMTDAMAEKVTKAAARRRLREERAQENEELRKRSRLSSFHRVRFETHKRNHALLVASEEEAKMLLKRANIAPSQEEVAAAAALHGVSEAPVVAVPGGMVTVKTEAKAPLDLVGLRDRLEQIRLQKQRKTHKGTPLAERLEPARRFWLHFTRHRPVDLSAEASAALKRAFGGLERGNKLGGRASAANTLDLSSNRVLWRPVKLGPWFRLSEGERLLVTRLSEMDTATRDLTLADWEALVRLDGRLSFLRERCSRLPMKAAAYALYGPALYDVFAAPLALLRQRNAAREAEAKRWQDEKALEEIERLLPPSTKGYTFSAQYGTEGLDCRDWELVSRFLPRVSTLAAARGARRPVAYSQLGVAAYGGEANFMDAAQPIVQQLLASGEAYGELCAATSLFSVNWVDACRLYIELAVARAIQAAPHGMLYTTRGGALIRVTNMFSGCLYVTDDKNEDKIIHPRHVTVHGTNDTEYMTWVLSHGDIIFTSEYNQPVVQRGEQLWLEEAEPQLKTRLPSVLTDIVVGYIRGEPGFP